MLKTRVVKPIKIQGSSKREFPSFRAMAYGVSSKFKTDKFRLQFSNGLFDLDVNYIKQFDQFHKPTAPNLAIIGNLGDPKSPQCSHFYNWLAKQYDQIIVVLNMSDYVIDSKIGKTQDDNLYNTHFSIDDIISRYSNIKVLHRERPSLYIKEHNLRIVGTTLWSHIPEHLLSTLQTTLPHFPKINRSSKYFNRLHETHLKWIKSEVEIASILNQRVIVVSDQAPLLTNVRSAHDKAHIYRYAFGTDLEDMIQKPIIGWFHNQSLYLRNQYVNGILVSSPSYYLDFNNGDVELDWDNDYINAFGPYGVPFTYLC